MGGAGHVACMGRGEVYTGFWWGDLREIDHLGGTTLTVVFESRVLRRIFEPKWDEVK